MGLYCVYIHKNKINGKRYVGITSQNVSRRWRNGNGYYENEHFSRAIKKYGWDSFCHEIVKAGLTKVEACELEKRLISKYKSNNEKYGYNKSIGGENPNEGVVVSDETRRKMSESHKGRVMSDATKQKLRDSAKVRGNGRSGMVGEKCGKSGILKQIDINTGDVVGVYYGYYDMQRKTGLSISPVMRAANGEQKQSYGFKWTYERREPNVAI